MAQDHIWAPLAEGQPTHHREPGQMIYLQDTEAAQFYYILTGTVKCFISSPDGDERTLALHHGGELIGEASFFDRQPRVSSAVAVTVISPQSAQQVPPMAALLEPPHALATVLSVMVMSPQSPALPPPPMAAPPSGSLLPYLVTIPTP